MYWRECACRQSSSTLVVPPCHLVKNVNIFYAYWWHEVTRATCTATHISEPPPQSGKGRKKKKGSAPALSNPKIRHFLVLPHLEVGGGEGGEVHQIKEGQAASSVEGSIMEAYFTDIGRGIEEPATEGPPPKRKEI